jgi:hypothetical protein
MLTTVSRDILHPIWVSLEKSGKFTYALLPSFEFSYTPLLLPLQLLSRGVAGMPTPWEEVTRRVKSPLLRRPPMSRWCMLRRLLLKRPLWRERA